MTRHLHRLSRLSAGEIQTLLAAGVAVLCVRVMLWTLPFSRVQKIYAGLVANRPDAQEVRGGSGAPVTQSVGVRREDTSRMVANVSLAVRSVSRLVPQASCLTQALATRELLARRGVKSRLQVGVAKKGDALEAHAWVERDGEIVIGRVPQMERFSVLPDSALNRPLTVRFD